ncbi:MAG: hypothetical protein ACH350_04340 [Parachlamydiaceae bacterium]
MIERSGISLPSDSELEFNETYLSSLPSAGCSALKFKWLAKIAFNRQQVSTLMYKIIDEESARKGDALRHSSAIELPPSCAFLDRMKHQRRNLLHSISNLLLPPSPLPIEIADPSLSSTHQETIPLVLWLKEKGYLELATKLQTHQGYPWDQFKKIRSPILIEQLVDLYLLCQHKHLTEGQTERITEFTLYLANVATSSKEESLYSHSSEMINDTKHLFGQFIYLINQDPAIIIESIDKSNIKEVLESIRDAFDNKIQEVCETLQNHYLAHDATQLQDADAALHARIPIEIARALLTERGTINIGIIDLLSDIFLSHEKRQINHEINLAHALSLLQQSPKLRSEFEKINIPKSEKTPSQDVIRATLELSQEAQTTELDSRLTALIAILSHLRQGGDRSCFAVSLAIEMLSSHMGFCLKDLRQLLEEGKLSRRVNGVKKDIPFSKRINDKNLSKEISFNSRGDLLIGKEKKSPLWEAPGLIAACQAIGLEDPKITIQTMIANLPNLDRQKSHKMEIKTLILKICEESQSEHSSSKSLNTLFNQACFAFSSQTMQPLLKVWENAIANMAEAEEGSMIKRNIWESSLEELQFKLEKSSIPRSLPLQRFFLSIKKELINRIKLQYDPTICYSAEGNEQTVEGGFVLYNDQERIHDKESFRSFLQEIIRGADLAMCKADASEADMRSFDRAITLLFSYLESDDFIPYLLARYHPANDAAIKKASHRFPLDYGALQFTPWLTQIGNNSKALLRIYLESEKPIPSEEFTISGAEEALTKIIEMCKHMSREEKELHLNNPNKLKPLSILGKHRFPFMAGNPSLAKAWTQNCSTKTWIQEFVINPGNEIANTLIDETTKKQLIGRLHTILSQGLPYELAHTIFRQIQEIAGPMTIKEFRNEVLAIVLRISPSDRSGVEAMTRQIDTDLCRSLPQELRQTLEDSAVHFADTNWSREIQDIHFCFAVNPGTGQLELWEAKSDGSDLEALNQNYWLFNQKWEFLTLPEDLIPDDSCYLNSE